MDGTAGVFIDELDGEIADESNHAIRIVTVEHAFNGRDGVTASYLADLPLYFLEVGAKFINPIQ